MKLIDHIAIFDDYIDLNFCEQVINYFEQLMSTKAIFRSKLPDEELTEAQRILRHGAYLDGTKETNRQKLGRLDESLLLNLLEANITNTLYSILQNVFNEYLTEYPTLTEAKITSVDLKMQRTPPGGGYHVWHDDRSEWGLDHRQVVWMMYLNDMPEGEAETEFYYQKLRIRPKAGTVVLWPAAYTHVHRGNIVFSQNKYVVTGWFCTQPL